MADVLFTVCRPWALEVHSIVLYVVPLQDILNVRSRQVRILYIVTAYPRTAEDVITPWMAETVRRLQERQITIEVLAPSYRGLRTHTVDGVLVHRFRYAPAPWESLTHDQTAPDRLRERPIYSGLLPGYIIAGSLAAARLARSREFDLVHAFWPVPHAIMGLAAKAAAGVPLISTFFGVELTWVRNQLPFLHPLLRLLVRWSDAVTVISSYTAAELQRACPTVQPTIIPFGATVAAPAYGTGGETVPSSRYELLFVGRLVGRKGVQILLQAMAQLPRTTPATLHIVGDGPDSAALQAQAAQLGLAEQVRFHGFVTSEELWRRFASCDVFVLPAVVDTKGDTEGLGVVLLEALSHGKPVIASAAGGVLDIVRHRETGLLVPPGDADALAGAIRECIADPARAAAMGAAGRQHVEREFSWDVILDRLEHVYRSVLTTGAVGRRRISHRRRFR